MSQTFRIVNGDFVLVGSTGRPSMVTDNLKARQDVRGMLSTGPTPNGVGSGLEQLVGQVTDPTTFRSLALGRIRSSFNTMVSLQQLVIPNQRSATERFVSITRLTVGPADLGLGIARTAYAFTLTVLTVAGSETPITLNGTVTAP